MQKVSLLLCALAVASCTTKVDQTVTDAADKLCECHRMAKDMMEAEGMPDSTQLQDFHRCQSEMQALMDAQVADRDFLGKVRDETEHRCPELYAEFAPFLK